MATTDNKIINGSGLSKLSSQIKSYVNDKTEISVGATAPTDNKIKLWVDTSATGEIAWNDITGKPDLATKAEVQQVEDKIPAPYTLPKATTSTLGGVMPDGNTITIADGVISAVGSGGGEPTAYIKDASVSGNTLTLTKKDNTNVVFTPSGGSSDIKSYSFQASSSSLTTEEIANLQYCVDNPNKVIFTIDNELVVSVKWQYNNWYFICLSYNSPEEVIKEYVIGTSNNSTTITGSHISINKSGAILITNNNIKRFSSSWQIASNLSDSSLYNARELAILFENNNGKCFSYYYNFNCSFDSAWDMGGLNMYANKNFFIQTDDNEYGSWYYDGSAINFPGNLSTNYRIFYKT